MIKFFNQSLVDIMNVFSEKKNYFVIAVVNYFTLTKAMTMLRQFMIVLLGTARFLTGWPSQNFKEIDDSQINVSEIF